jgi:predicted DNA-binding protein with PD1-like motif
MQYREGRFGRVFLLKFDDGDDLLTGLRTLARKEDLRAATITLLGGLRSAGIVTGPREAVVPPEPVWFEFADGREIVGTGTLFWKDDEPAVHLHGAIGRGAEARVGCVRKDSTVYLVIEAVVAEVTGIEARRAVDERSGLAMLDLS